MRVLLTGGAGYIGSITARLLLDEGHDCVVLDDLSRGHAELVDVRAQLVVGDVGDPFAVQRAVVGCDAVLHFAGLIDVEESEREPEWYFDVNSRRPLALLDAVQEEGIDAFVFSSTAAVYGEPESVPIEEDSALRPVNAYGESKLAFERSLLEREGSGLKSIRLRYFNVAGALPDASLGEAHVHETHIIPRVLAAVREGRRAFEVFGDDYPTPDGTCVRDYIHVVDLARAHILALDRLRTGGPGGAFNLGNGRGFSNREVVNECAEVTGTAIEVKIGPRREGDPAILVASAQKAEDELGWVRERSSLRTIVEDAWRWHLAQASGYR